MHRHGTLVSYSSRACAARRFAANGNAIRRTNDVAVARPRSARSRERDEEWAPRGGVPPRGGRCGARRYGARRAAATGRYSGKGVRPAPLELATSAPPGPATPAAVRLNWPCLQSEDPTSRPQRPAARTSPATRDGARQPVPPGHRRHPAPSQPIPDLISVFRSRSPAAIPIETCASYFQRPQRRPPPPPPRLDLPALRSPPVRPAQYGMVRNGL